MIRFTMVVASALFLIGCDSGVERALTVVSPSPLSPPSTPAPPPPAPVPPPAPPPPNTPPPIDGEIPVGVNFSDVLATAKWYLVRAPSSGTLVATLRWDPNASRLLALAIGGEWFYGSSPQWSPIIGRAPVSAGEIYLVGVEWANPWDYRLSASSTPFVITITIE